MKKSFLKRRITETIRDFDSETGELMGENNKEFHFLANSDEEFFLSYVSIIGIFMNMEASEIRVFGYMLQYADGKKFDMTKRVRIEIAKCTNLNERTIYNIIPSLLEKKLIFKHDDGLYQLNPRYIYRGSSRERKLELVTVLKIDRSL